MQSLNTAVCLHSLTQLKLGHVFVHLMANLMKRASLFAKKSAVELTDVVDVFTHRYHDCAALLCRFGYLHIGCLINEGRFLRCLIDGNDTQFRR